MASMEYTEDVNLFFLSFIVLVLKIPRNVTSSSKSSTSKSYQAPRSWLT